MRTRLGSWESSGCQRVRTNRIPLHELALDNLIHVCLPVVSDKAEPETSQYSLSAAVWNWSQKNSRELFEPPSIEQKLRTHDVAGVPAVARLDRPPAQARQKRSNLEECSTDAHPIKPVARALASRRRTLRQTPHLQPHQPSLKIQRYGRACFTASSRSASSRSVSCEWNVEQTRKPRSL